MKHTTAARYSSIGRAAKKVENQFYGQRTEKSRSIRSSKRRGFLDKILPDYFFGCPPGMTVVPAVHEGRTLKGIFFIIPIE